METVFNITLRPSLNYNTFQQFTAVQGDKNTRQIQAEILNDDGTAFTPEIGVVAEYWSQKPDGNGTSHSASISGNIVTVELNEQDLAVAGKVYASIVFKKENEILTAMPFYFRVIPAPLGRDVPSSNDYLTMVAATEAAEDATEEALTAARRTPYINSANNHWMIWDADSAQYVDTEVVAKANSPYINPSNEHWMVWDETTEQYIDSGISASGADGVVLYSATQSLSNTDKERARGNIGASASADIGVLSDLTTTEKGSLVGAINELDDDLTTTATSISAYYDATATYSVGDYCIHDYRLYRCTTAIITPEAWTDAHWTIATVTELVNAVNNRTKKCIATTPVFTSLPQTFTDSQLTFGGSITHIESDMIVTPRDYIASNSSAIGPDWEVNTDTEGQLTITGTFVGTTGTSLKLFLSRA